MEAGEFDGEKTARRTHYFREDFLGFSGREPKATRVLKARYSFVTLFHLLPAFPAPRSFRVYATLKRDRAPCTLEFESDRWKLLQ